MTTYLSSNTTPTDAACEQPSPASDDAASQGNAPQSITEAKPTFKDLLAGKTFKIAWGKNHQDRNFANIGGPGENLYAALSTFAKGAKNGPCLLQGRLISDGQRLGQRVAENVLLMVDHDTGKSVREIEEIYREAGVAALIYTTHSHLKATSGIPEKAIIAYAQKVGAVFGHAADISDDVVLGYLQTEKKYEPSILEGATVKSDWGNNGKEFVVQHKPMPRLRSVMLLAQPFDFGDRKWGSQKDAIDIWKAKYAAVCEQLGLSWDTRARTRRA